MEKPDYDAYRTDFKIIRRIVYTLMVIVIVVIIYIILK